MSSPYQKVVSPNMDDLLRSRDKLSWGEVGCKQTDCAVKPRASATLGVPVVRYRFCRRHMSRLEPNLTLLHRPREATLFKLYFSLRANLRGDYWAIVVDHSCGEVEALMPPVAHPVFWGSKKKGGD